MDRDQLEHVIRAVGDLLGDDEVILFGSQAILGTFPDDLPRSVLVSREVDVAPVDGDPEKALRINGAIGELTLFDSSYGYYAEGAVIEGLARLPAGWRERLVPVRSPATNGVTGLCLEPHDLCVAKLLARRPGDSDYVRALVQSGHVKREVVLERLRATDASPQELEVAQASLESMGKVGRGSAFRRALRAAPVTAPPSASHEPAEMIPRESADIPAPTSHPPTGRGEARESR